ncbi:unnamed protein product [Cylindrotheca closterium]|uniref:Uncharacterized protein n=1 Tax=Cylindrotheca closterium TaxID=2856 RepID=A0AAD2CXD7_9STRA|nr:unnamed protein product [Cylindrotheca closterium]
MTGRRWIQIWNPPYRYLHNKITHYLDGAVATTEVMAFRYKGQSRDKVPHSVSHVIVDTIVWEIPDNAFSGCDSLALLELPVGLQTIGEYALAYCDSLLKLILPATVHTIFGHAFDNCRSLREVEIAPSSHLKHLGPEVFRSCHSLQEVDLPEGITALSAGIFSDCRSLTKIRIPSTVEVVDDDAFRECLSLLLVTFGNRLVQIGTGAFYSCTSLMNVKIPSSVKTIDDGAFEACGHLISIEIDDGLSEIGNGVFNQCHSLMNVAIPQSTKWSADGTLLGCGQISDYYPTMEMLQQRYGHDMLIHELCYKQAHHPERSSMERLKKLKEDQGGLSSLSSQTHADTMGMNPFHILSISTKPNLSLFSELLHILPKRLVQAPNVNGQSPLQLLKDNHAFGSAALIRFILEVTILEPSRWFGLEAWRKDLSSAVQRTFKTNTLEQVSSRGRRITQIQTKYFKYERLETTSLLEQAVWKSTMSRQKRSSRTRKLPKVNSDSRLAARMSSGAQVIIPNVNLFLGKPQF